MELAKKFLTFRLARFVVVGVGNTAVNFAVLNVAYYGLHQGKIVSSFIATAVAMTVSFILNRHFVFRDKNQPLRQVVSFIAVTTSGVLLVQNLVYAVGVSVMPKDVPSFISINLSNAVASLCVMLWNYNGYRLFVFNHKEQQHATETA